MVLEYIPYIIVAVIVAVFLLKGLVTIRPTHVGAKETFGKYTGYKTQGLNYVIPINRILLPVYKHVDSEMANTFVLSFLSVLHKASYDDA